MTHAMTDDVQALGGEEVLPDGSVVELSAADAQAVLDAAEKAEDERRRKLSKLAERLMARCDDVVQAKRPIEARWIDDLRQYEGNSRLADTKGDKAGASSGEAPRIHITRARTDLWEARLADMLLPVQDSAWDLEPDVSDGIARDQAERQQIDNACERMRETIESQLSACNFGRAARRMIRDSCRIGAGLLMGPMNGIKRKRRFDQETSTLVIEETTTPEIREADPWCYFPDMVANTEDAEFAYYLHLMSRRELIELADYPGFDGRAIRDVLAKDPNLGEVARNIQVRNKGLDAVEPTTGRYAVWRYTGVLAKDDLAVLGLCGCDDGAELDELAQAMVDLWFCGSHVLSSKLAPVPDDFRVPYYVLSPFPADDTPFGYSLPYMCRDSARFADAAYRIGLHNLSVSSGPQMFMRKGVLKPADGKHDIRGPKLWWVDDLKGGDRPLNQLLSVEIIPNVADKAFAALDKALRIVDMELNAEGWASQEGAEEVPTASGLAMLMNTKSIIQRRAAACADDEVFQPLIERMYWWNMQFNEAPGIHGEFNVVTNTQSVLLVKDVQVQHTMAFLQSVYGNPKFAPYVDDYEALTATSRLFDIPNRGKLLRSKEEGDELAQQQQQNPEVALIAARTQTEQARAEVMQIEAQIKQQAEQRKAQEFEEDSVFREANRDMEHDEAMAQLKTRLIEAETRREIAMMRESTARMAAMQRMDMSAAQLEATLRKAGMDSDAKLRTKGLDASMQAKEMALKTRFGSGI